MAGENNRESQIGYTRIASSGKRYVYDKTTNACFQIPETADLVLSEFLAQGAEAVRRRYQHRVSQEELCVALNYLDELKTHYGMFQPSPRIDLPGFMSSGNLEQLLVSPCRQLTLNITEQCNQRCTYCVYSGDHPGERSHTDKEMSWPVARKSIDHLLSRSLETVNSRLNFYGGEPLLNWDLVRRCIEYARCSETGRRLKISLSSNLTLLNDEIARFLVDHDVNCSISLDGPQEIHDSARVFAGGGGTHDRVIRQIRKLMEIDPDYCRSRLTILCTFNRTSDMGELFDYFSQDPFKDLVIEPNTAREPGSIAARPSPRDRPARRKQVDRLVRSYLASVRAGESKNHRLFQKMFQTVFTKIARRGLKLDHGDEILERLCIPGVNGIFVSADGRFFACENFAHPENSIGSVEMGIDTDRVRSLLATYTGFCQEACRECWVSRLCSLCFVHTLDQGRISKERMRESCVRQREAIARAFERFLYLWENEPVSFHDSEFSLHAAVRQSGLTS